MSEMSLQESIERFDESMKRAVSRARELNYFAVARQLDMLRQQGMKLIKSRALTRNQALAMIDRHIDTRAAKETQH